jgi:hypothetical protein
VQIVNGGVWNRGTAPHAPACIQPSSALYEPHCAALRTTALGAVVGGAAT